MRFVMTKALDQFSRSGMERTSLVTSRCECRDYTTSTTPWRQLRLALNWTCLLTRSRKPWGVLRALEDDFSSKEKRVGEWWVKVMGTIQPKVKRRWRQPRTVLAEDRS